MSVDGMTAAAPPSAALGRTTLRQRTVHITYGRDLI